MQALDAEKSAHGATMMALGINAAFKDQLLGKTELLASAMSIIGCLNKRLLATKYGHAQFARHHVQNLCAARARSRDQDETTKLAVDVIGVQLLVDR